MGRIKLIPNSLYDVLTLLKEKTIDQVKEHYQGVHDEGIDKYIQLLSDQDYGFFTDDPTSFPDMSLEWATPSRLTNAILDFAANSNHQIDKIVAQLNMLGCRSLLLRFFEPIEMIAIEGILEVVSRSGINSAEIILVYDEGLASGLKTFHQRFLLVRSVTLHGAPENGEHYFQDMDLHLRLTTDKIASEESCGIVDESLFTSNIEHFTESMQFNSCLNCKVGIDRNGLIKNCPSMKVDYGSISEVSLEAVVNDKDFRKVWTIRKDDINVCKDCEFRHVCTDCRAYVVDDHKSIFPKPLKCNYDPYTATWLKSL